MLNIKTFDISKTTSNPIKKMLAIPLLGFMLTGCKTNGGTTDHSTIETFHVAPHTQKCTGPHRIEQECLVVNGQAFRDNIAGFNFEWGYDYELKVKKTLTCNPNVANSCPQDYEIYDYVLVKVVSKRKANDTDDNLKTLEVIGFSENPQEFNQVYLVNLERTMRFNMLLDPSHMTGQNFRDKTPLVVGDRVKVDGIYLESNPVQIVNIHRIIKIDNPDKTACEAQANKVWRPEGRAQIPSCVTVYSDAGKPCQSSNECEGSCMIHNKNGIATCASDDSKFGCGATIEQFRLNGSIMCVD